MKEEAALLPGGLFTYGTNRALTSYPAVSPFGGGSEMFCDQCGSQLDVNQRFCSRCGKEVTSSIAIAAPRPGRVAAHVRLLAILWLAFAALEAVSGLGALVVGNWLFSRWGPGGVPIFVHPLMMLVGILSLAKAAAGFLAGWGLLNRQSWARMLTIVLGVIALFHIPFGTALGIYTLWVLLPSHSEEEYQNYQRAQAA